MYRFSNSWRLTLALKNECGVLGFLPLLSSSAELQENLFKIEVLYLIMELDFDILK